MLDVSHSARAIVHRFVAHLVRMKIFKALMYVGYRSSRMSDTALKFDVGSSGILFGIFSVSSCSFVKLPVLLCSAVIDEKSSEHTA